MRTLILFCLIALGLSATAQQKTEHLEIKSSTVCNMCVQTIESNLIYEKGVSKVHVDLATSSVHIDFNPRKNSPDKLRAALIKLGYAADGVPGDAKAFANLPACCQKEGCGKLPEDGTH